MWLWTGLRSMLGIRRDHARSCVVDSSELAQRDQRGGGIGTAP